MPEEQWKILKATNVIDRLHEEFRRRVKTAACRPRTRRWSSSSASWQAAKSAAGFLDDRRHIPAGG